jgi:hypothetical protein
VRGDVDVDVYAEDHTRTGIDTGDVDDLDDVLAVEALS